MTFIFRCSYTVRNKFMFGREKRMTPPRGRLWSEYTVGFSPYLILIFFTAHMSTLVSVSTRKSVSLWTSLLSAASLGPRPRSDSSLIPPTFCVEMIMDCSCGDEWIVAYVDALGVKNKERTQGWINAHANYLLYGSMELLPNRIIYIYSYCS